MIEWCNNNAGIIAAIQTLLTVMLSILAVGVTIYFSRLQYKKGMKIYSALFYDSKGNYRLDLYLFNMGNVPLYITGIRIMREYQDHTTDRKELGMWFSDSLSDKEFLNSKMAVSFSLNLRNCNAFSPTEDTNIKVIIETHEKNFIYRTNWAVG